MSHTAFTVWQERHALILQRKFTAPLSLPCLTQAQREQHTAVAAAAERERAAAALPAAEAELALARQRLEVAEKQQALLREQISSGESNRAAVAAERQRLQVRATVVLLCTLLGVAFPSQPMHAVLDSTASKLKQLLHAPSPVGCRPRRRGCKTPRCATSAGWPH